MKMTEKLKKKYSNNTSNVRTYDCLEISHPDFTQTYYFINDSKEKEFKNSDGDLVSFIPLSFSAVLPAEGDNQQDLKLILDNSNMQLSSELLNATNNYEDAILIKSAIYIDGELEPQSQVYVLEMKNINVTYKTIVGTASSVDMIDISFPRESFDQRFNGLNL